MLLFQYHQESLLIYIIFIITIIISRSSQGWRGSPAGWCTRMTLGTNTSLILIICGKRDLLDFEHLWQERPFWKVKIMIISRRDATEFAGKRLLLIGSSYSAEDIALQCLKYVLVCRWVYNMWSYNLWRGINLIHCSSYKNCCPLFKFSFEKVRSSKSNLHLEKQAHGLQVAKQCERSFILSNDT